MKTADLIDEKLDWAVAKAQGSVCVRMFEGSQGFRVYENESMKMQGIPFRPSTYWQQGGPIIEREDISFRKYHNPKSEAHGKYYAKVCRESGSMIQWSNKRDMTGPTPLIAAMRCFVASKLGYEVEIPEDLK